MKFVLEALGSHFENCEDFNRPGPGLVGFDPYGYFFWRSYDHSSAECENARCPLAGFILATPGHRAAHLYQVSARGFYPLRMALIGEIVAARPAGMIAARKVHPASDPAATVRAKGSQKDTP
jgi:hypothetical protein